MSNPKKPSSMAAPGSSSLGRRQSATSHPHRPPSPKARGSSPARVLTTNGTARTPAMKSPSGVARPNRASVRRPSSIVGSIGNIGVFGEEETQEEDARAENAVLVDNLKKSLRNAEVMCEEHRQQAEAMQQKMDQMLKEHAKLEERFHESTMHAQELEKRKKEDSRQVRDMASLYESERAAMLRDREEASTRERELQATVQRLKETMAGREMRFNVASHSERRSSRSGRSLSRSSSIDENAQFAPSSSQRQGSSSRREDSRSATRVAMQKDMVIESLRLELAEAQIKLVEMENMGGDKVQDLEKTLLEARMTNARLLEDNESFQLLLGEKTLNGDITKAEFMQPPGGTAGGLGSLAEELESAEGESENYRRLEAELRSLKEQNKALTLYVEKIISRVLQHDNYENILSDKDTADKDEMAPPPPPKDGASQPSIVQRAMSVVGPRRPRPSSLIASNAPAPYVQPEDPATATLRPRPTSQAFSQAPQPHASTAHENPTTAPSIPLGRSASISARGGRPHRRTPSDRSVDTNLTGHGPSPGAVAALVSQMYRGPPPGPTRPISPSSPSTTAARSYFGPNPLGTAGGDPPSASASASANTRHSSPSGAGRRTTSGLRTVSSTSAGARPPTRGSDTSTLASRESAGGSTGKREAPSPPRNAAGSTVYTGAVMAQSRLRPLRLVQETTGRDGAAAAPGTASGSDEMARKRANRQSWLGWFNKGKDEGSGEL